MMSKRKSHNKLLPCRAASCLQSSLVSVVVSVAVLSSAGFDYPVVSSCRANETKPEIEKQLGERDLGTWQAVGSYPDDGLSPLYVTTVDSIQTIIATQPSAVILPRSIGRVELSQSGMPCFQMHCGDSYYLNRNDILWAASQEHGGNFRLFYDANLVAMSHNAKQFLISFGFGGREIFDGDTWEKYSPMTGGLPTSGAMTFGPEGWPYFILDGRIYRKQRDRWTLQKIGSMQTRWAEITSNSNGQIFARSKPDEEGVLLFALHNGEEWRSCDVPQSDLSNGSYHLCDSGMIVVVSPEHVQVFDHRDLRPYDWTIASSKKYQDSIVIPNENCVYFVGLSNASEPRPEGNCSEVVLHVMRLTFQDCHFKSRQFSQVVKTVSVSAETTDPSTRAIDQKTNSHDLRGGSTNPSIAHRVRPQKPAAALPNHRITLVARPKGGIVIQVKGLGVFSVDDSNPNAETITELDLPTIVHSRAGILGCDIHDMIYFSLPTQGMSLKASSGDRSFMACAIVPQNMVPFTELVESGRSFANSGVDQFVNTSEGLLFIASSNETAYQPQSAPSPRISRANQSANTAGQMLIWKPSKREPCLLDDRLVSIDQLIPGRDGAVIAIYADGHAALIHKAKVIAYEYSLAYLTTEHFDLMLELAPTNPCDTRFSNRVTLPLMSTGKTIWFNDSEGNLHRVTSGDKPPELIQTFGPTELVGRLHDGTLLVRPKASDGRLGGKRGDLREWSWIEEPDKTDVAGDPFLPTVRNLEAPPKEQNGGLLGHPEAFTGGWLTSDAGTIYLTQGFDRVFVIRECDQWRMYNDFGSPLLEDTQNRVWAFRSARVYRGYQVADEEEEKRYTCIPTYLALLTPVEQIGNRMLCTTPLGLASFSIDLRGEPENDITVREQHLVEPCEYLGHIANTVFLSTSDGRVVKVESDLY